MSTDDTSSEGGWTDHFWAPMIKAAEAGKSPVGYDVNKLLINASDEGHLVVVRCLVEKYGVDVDTVDQGDRMALFAAAMYGHFDIAKFLVEKGASITKTTRNGWTALMLAAFKGHLPIVKYLVENGADIFHSESRQDKRTALDLAIEKGPHTEVVTYLIAEGNWQRRRSYAIALNSIASASCQQGIYRVLYRVLQGNDTKRLIGSFL